MPAAYVHHNDLSRIADELSTLLEACCLCPHKCGVNRLKDEKGFCRTGLKARVFSFMPHRGEEPPISGKRGSGTIFFSGCNMRCVYCQNHEFSQAEAGREMTERELAEAMLALQQMKCHNINLVSPTHVLPQILKALVIARGEGLNLPLVYNTGGYESAEILERLDGIMDIYLPDMRYGDDAMSRRYSDAPGYVRFNRSAVKEMFRQRPRPEYGDDGLMLRGLIIRHLVLPGGISGTAGVMKFISEELSSDTHVSLMSQYLPCYRASGYEELSRRLTRREYEQAQAAMEDAGLSNGWVQESGGLARFAGEHIKRSV